MSKFFREICDEVGYKGQLGDLSDGELKNYWLGRGLPTTASGDFSQIPMKPCIDCLLCCGEMVARGYMKETCNAVEILTCRKPLSSQEALVSYKQAFAYVWWLSY